MEHFASAIHSIQILEKKKADSTSDWGKFTFRKISSWNFPFHSILVAGIIH